MRAPEKRQPAKSSRPSGTGKREPPAIHQLQALPQWVAWRYEDRDGKRTKVPYQSPTARASATDPATWLSHADATALIAAHHGEFNGVGFVVSAADPYCGIDLDDCRDPQTETLTPEAAAIVARFNSYTEVTPSGAGIRIWIRGTKPGSRCRKEGIEIYDRDRFFTLTGKHVAGTPTTIEQRQGELTAFYTETFSATTSQSSSTKPIPAPGPSLSDHAVLAQALGARSGNTFYRLYQLGDTSAYKNDDSAAEAAACAFLAHQTRDPAQIDRLMRSSRLATPDRLAKWDDRRRDLSWLTQTIRKALALVEPHHPRTRFQLLTAAELLMRPDPEWLIEHWLPVGGVGTLYGSWGSGKSFLALDWALHVAADLPWLGDCSVRQGPVIYVVGEGVTGFKLRLAAWRAAHHHEETLPIWFLPEPVALLQPNEVGEFLTAIQAACATPPALIVFDTLSRMAGGADENSQKDMSGLVSTVDRLRRETGAAVLFVHHQPYDEHRMRGSSVLPGAMDAIYSLTKNGTALVLTTTKQKDAEPAASRALKLTNVDASLVIESDRTRPLALADRIYAFIVDNPRCGFNAIRKATGCNRATLNRTLSRLVTEGQVRNEGNGKRGRRHAYVAVAPDSSAIRIVRDQPDPRRAK